MTAAKLLQGNWAARWGAWIVGLRSCGSSWNSTVWRRTSSLVPAARRELDSWDGFKTAEEAVTWACDVMRADGAEVMVLGAPGLKLEGLLSFSPAPEIVHA